MNWNDPAIWSALIAIVAVILSQLPPLRDLLKGRKVTINPSETFQLYHHMGNPHITFFLDIHNIGGSKVVIDRIDCIVVDENNKTWSLPAHSYISREFTDQNGNQLEFPVSWIVLKPEERWNETLHLYKFWPET